MSEQIASTDNPFGLTAVERSAALVPWRYASTTWEMLDSSSQKEGHWLPRLLAWLLVLGLAVLGGAVLWQFSPIHMDGHIDTIVAGRLLIQDGKDAPWFEAEAGRFIRPGARLRAEPGTIATMRFDDGSQLRIESGGEWVCVRLAQSRNRRIKRLQIRQVRGKASYISAPTQQGADARIAVDLPDVQLLLRGVATVAQASDQGGQITLWQGTGKVMAFEQRLVVQAGDQISYDRAKRQMARTVGMVSR